ncbi:hypothetical protein J9978_03115 [Chromobacterium violaceum]|uniref:hypothetical protein n=1 Tax=Chromobacterium violaceum TaxID=536 RepID=UPI00111C5C0B|nr:hypothetical protein [Chromobacterium violaceum]MBP4048490.1 hypothetical protein [Chromobacterium violaceum]MCD0491820.1 hypothetical protein [Chromobacterium violaceum]
MTDTGLSIVGIDGNAGNATKMRATSGAPSNFLPKHVMPLSFPFQPKRADFLARQRAKTTKESMMKHFLSTLIQLCNVAGRPGHRRVKHR